MKTLGVDRYAEFNYDKGLKIPNCVEEEDEDQDDDEAYLLSVTRQVLDNIHRFTNSCFIH